MKNYRTIEDYEKLKTQEARVFFCREILHTPAYKYYKHPLCRSDHVVMLNVFKNHSHADEKRLNEVHEIFVQKSVKSRRVAKGRVNYCFHLQYKDGTADDISFMNCIHKTNKHKRVDIGRARFMTMPQIDDTIPTKAENLEQAMINRSIPESSGVYFIWHDCELIYIGHSRLLRNRVALDESHFHTVDPNKKYINYIECDSKEEARQLENKLIRKLVPLVKTLKNNCSIARSLRNL